MKGILHSWHVDIRVQQSIGTLMRVILCIDIACCFKVGNSLGKRYIYWALLTPSWDPPFKYTGRRHSFEAVSMKKVGFWP